MSATESHIVVSPSVSSVDEEVPRPRIVVPSSCSSPPVTAVVQSQSEEAVTMGRKPSVTTLNPSTSRFSLRMPLLGRPKVPLQQAVPSSIDDQSGPSIQGPRGQADAAAQYLAPETSSLAQVQGDTSSPQSVPPQGPEASAISVPDTAEVSAPSEAVKSVSSSENEKTPSVQQTQDSKAASWWDYVGWSRGSQHVHEEHAADAETPRGESVRAQPDEIAATASLQPLEPSQELLASQPPAHSAADRKSVV